MRTKRVGCSPVDGVLQAVLEGRRGQSCSSGEAGREKEVAPQEETNGKSKRRRESDPSDPQSDRLSKDSKASSRKGSGKGSRKYPILPSPIMGCHLSPAVKEIQKRKKIFIKSMPT